MLWIAPPEKDTGTETLESRLWAAADQLRANSGLTSAQYSQPVLGLIFLRFAEVRYLAQRALLEKVNTYFNSVTTLVGKFVQVGPDGNKTEGQFYMQKPGKIRFEYDPPSPIELISDGDTVAVSVMP